MVARLTGTWVGEYTYGPDYAAEGVAGRSVPFTMSLTESSHRRIAGYVRDNAARGGQPERGRVLGSRRGARIEFTKVMPVGYVTDADGKLIELREFLARSDVELPARLPPHRISYRGTLDEQGENLRGEWMILPWPARQAAGDASVHRGTWTARRQSYQPSEV